ncbi:MAG: tRNA pseudouridine synthase B [Gammaproteobacteria bacterium SG8_47]|nr:MAG: tRNA pseudouridine synthase B [Gammaproteobacteria bacterium SG8_47]
MGRRRSSGRNVHGILLLDKPVGITSNAALQTVKRLYRANKAGHTGNLDPMASGVLPICLGEATKMSAFLLEADKRYRGIIKLGVRTSTADAEGEVLETHEVPALSAEVIESVLARFRGRIEQVPPMHSAVKYKGQPLYKLAHKGLEVERKAREIEIYALDLVRIEGDELEVDVHCTKGTYVRTLAEDIGAALGCGGHLSALRRTAVGMFRLDDAVALAELQHLAEDADAQARLDEFLLPMEEALAGWPAVNLTENTAFYLRQGQPVLVPKAPSQGWVRLFTQGHEFIGVGQIMDDGRVAPRRLVSTA